MKKTPTLGINLQLPNAGGGWENAGRLSTAANGGLIRTGALFWEAFWGGPQVRPDLGYIVRQVEVAKGAGAGLLVLLQPTPHPESKWGSADWWNPRPELWPDIVRCNNMIIAAYDAECTRQGIPRPYYQLLNEMTGNKPGGSGTPGLWTDDAHEFIFALCRGIPPSVRGRLIAPAISDLGEPSECREWRTCQPRPRSNWTASATRSIHVRVNGHVGISPTDWAEKAVAEINAAVDAVRELSSERGKNRPVDVTEFYCTPGGVGHPESTEEAIGEYRVQLLMRLDRLKCRFFIPYGADSSVIEGESPYAKYGGWANSIWSFRSR
ncbi:MAG: hypothetical protein C4320_00450 [Armatimonadota bacterium]